MIEHTSVTDGRLKLLIRSQKITMAGNQPLKIYGLLTCSSGKRMKKENRVFFGSRHEAEKAGFRPCGNCLPDDYLRWKLSASI